MTDALMSITAQQYIMQKATEAPEEIYATIKAAEDWLEELKDIARKGLNSRIPENVTTYDFNTATHIINVTRNRGKFKPEVVHDTLSRLKIDTNKITYEKPRQYGCTPEAYDILSAYLQQNIITKSQYDSMFEKGNFTVKVKPKSNLAIAINSQNGE